MRSENPNDPFRSARLASGVMKCPFQGEDIPMILRHADVRATAKDWQTFSSDAPFRVPIPSEEEVRTMRQLPIEVDPPKHSEYRTIVDPFFKRPRSPEMAEQVMQLISGLVTEALANPEIEIVNQFALPLQSRALTYLLNVPEEEADLWISWGIHVFKVDGKLEKKGNALEDYLSARFDQAESVPGDDFFSALSNATFHGKPLNRTEMMGFANLAFAGGRDTIIHSISSIIGYFGKHPEALTFLREDPKRLTHAAEEFFRVFMPLTHIGRVCPIETDVMGTTVPAGGRVSLGWVSANHDESVFENPEEIRLDRKPNPHVSFGFGTHLCLGAAHARLIVKCLLQCLCESVGTIEIVSEQRHVEHEAAYERTNGYDALTVRFLPR